MYVVDGAASARVVTYVSC